MKHVTKNNTTAFIEISQRDLTNRRVLLRDNCLVWPRTFTEGLTPAEIDSNNYYTKTEVDEKISGISGVVTKEYVDAADNYLSGQIDLKASNADLDEHTLNTTIHVTAEDKTAWNAKASTTYVDAQDGILSTAIDTKASNADLDEHTLNTTIHVTAENKATWNGKQDAINAENKLAYSLISGTPTIPTKTSDLTNDSDFQTSTQVGTTITTAISGKADKTEIPTKTSDLTNDSEFATSAYVDSSVSGKVNTSTFNSHTSDTEIHTTSLEKAAWDAKQTAITTENKLAYSLISGTPTIPTKTSDLTNDSDFQNNTQVATSITTAISGKADSSELENYAEKDYFYIENLSGNNTVAIYAKDSAGILSAVTIEISTDKKTWTAVTPSIVTNAITQIATFTNAGERIYIRGNNSSWSVCDEGYTQKSQMTFISTAKINLGGNIMSIIDKTCKSTTIPCNGCFYGAFMMMDVYTPPITEGYMQYQINDISKLKMPAMDLTVGCYASMFVWQMQLTGAGSLILPATTMKSTCYKSMFQTLQGDGPTIKAKTLTTNCFKQMFLGATLANLKVEFTEWDDAENATKNWFDSAISGVFICDSRLDMTTRDISHVPSNFTILYDLFNSDNGVTKTYVDTQDNALSTSLVSKIDSGNYVTSSYWGAPLLFGNSNGTSYQLFNTNNGQTIISNTTTNDNTSRRVYLGADGIQLGCFDSGNNARNKIYLGNTGYTHVETTNNSNQFISNFSMSTSNLQFTWNALSHNNDQYIFIVADTQIIKDFTMTNNNFVGKYYEKYDINENAKQEVLSAVNGTISGIQTEITHPYYKDVKWAATWPNDPLSSTYVGGFRIGGEGKVGTGISIYRNSASPFALNAPSGLATTDYLSANYVPLTSSTSHVKVVSSGTKGMYITYSPADFTIACADSSTNYSTRLSLNEGGAYLRRITAAGDTNWCNLNAPSGLATTDYISGNFVPAEITTSTLTGHIGFNNSSYELELAATNGGNQKTVIGVNSAYGYIQYSNSLANTQYGIFVGDTWLNGIAIRRGSNTLYNLNAPSGLTTTDYWGFTSDAITSGTASSTAVNLVEGEVVTHIPDAATTYTLPAITDLTKTHECNLEVDFTNTQSFSIVAADSKTVQWLDEYIPEAGKIARFNIFYSNLRSAWIIQTIKLN